MYSPIGTILFAYAIHLSTSEESLRLVHVFFRHGGRTPEAKDQFPSDPYVIDEFLPMGLGQLTNEGKHTAFVLGSNLRRRYGSFLGGIYTPDIVQAISTDFDRTKMTVLAVLAGLFPPTESQMMENNLSWIPIPYEYDKANNDFMLRRPTGYCPTYVDHLNTIKEGDVGNQVLKDYQDVFKYVSKHTGKELKTLDDMFGVFQTLTAEKFMNLSLPEWTLEAYPRIYEIASKLCNIENYDDILKRLNGGRSLAKILRNIVAKVTGTLVPEGRKIFLYSGHENNVINVLAALNLFKPHVPEYCAAVMIELHHSKEDSYTIKVFYAKDPYTEPELMTLENCEPACPLRSFIRIIEPHLPVNYTAECNSTKYLD